MRSYSIGGLEECNYDKESYAKRKEKVTMNQEHVIAKKKNENFDKKLNQLKYFQPLLRSMKEYETHRPY